MDNDPDADLQLSKMEREVGKLHSGFEQLKRKSREPMIIVSPPWGCGAFGGDFRVKILLMWIAASLSDDHGVEVLRIVGTNQFLNCLGTSWREVLQRIKGLKVEELWKLLTTCEDASSLWKLDGEIS